MTAIVPVEYAKMQNWQDKHEINIAVAQDCVDNIWQQYESGQITEQEYQAKEKGYIDTYNEQAKELGLEYDFMNNKDVNNKEEYDSQLKKFAMGELILNDINGDGKVSRSEYIQAQASDSAGELTPEMKAEAKTLATLAFDAIASLVLADSDPNNDDIDEYLTQSDFENMYKTLDGFNFNEVQGAVEFDGNFDGKLNIDSFSAFMEYATASVPQETIDSIYNEFLEA